MTEAALDQTEPMLPGPGIISLLQALECSLDALQGGRLEDRLLIPPAQGSERSATGDPPEPRAERLRLLELPYFSIGDDELLLGCALGLMGVANHRADVGPPDPMESLDGRGRRGVCRRGHSVRNRDRGGPKPGPCGGMRRNPDQLISSKQAIEAGLWSANSVFSSQSRRLGDDEDLPWMDAMGSWHNRRGHLMGRLSTDAAAPSQKPEK